jgi:Fe-S-cluster-containing hydrogenase component 2
VTSSTPSPLPAEPLASRAPVPSEERLRRGPVAVILCDELLPCDPCVGGCPNGCITLTEPVIGLPVLDADACDGCGACITSCPAGAILVVDLSASPEVARVWLSYEMLPLPSEGDSVIVLDASGQPLGEARVVTVRPPEAGDGTAVVCVEVPQHVALRVAALRPAAPR